MRGAHIQIVGFEPMFSRLQALVVLSLSYSASPELPFVVSIRCLNVHKTNEKKPTKIPLI